MNEPGAILSRWRRAVHFDDFGAMGAIPAEQNSGLASLAVVAIKPVTALATLGTDRSAHGRQTILVVAINFGHSLTFPCLLIEVGVTHSCLPAFPPLPLVRLVGGKGRRQLFQRDAEQAPQSYQRFQARPPAPA